MTSPATTDLIDPDDEVFGLSGKQARAYKKSTGRVNIWDGAVRSGKTYAWTLLIIREVRAYRGGAAILISGKNRDSIYRNVFEPIENDPNLALIKPFVHYRQGAPFAWIWGRKVHIVGANDEGSESRIRGMTIARAFSDEVTITNKSFFKQLQARLSKRGAKLWATTNPDTPGHWLMKDYLKKIPGCRHFDTKTPEGDQLPHWTYWHFTMEDNPSLDEEYKDNLRREYTGVWFRRFILGEWVAADGAIYDFFDTHTHVVDAEKIPAMQRVFSLGIDYGTTHPTRGYLLGLGVDGKLYLVDEWAPPRGTDGSLSADLMRKRSEWAEKGWSPEWTYHDPAAASFGLQLFEDGHPNVTKADNAVIDGIRTVASLLQNGDLLISSVCTELIDELPGYRWDDKAGEKGIEQPVKENDDACLVAGTMVSTPDGEVPIEQIHEGDLISVSQGVYTVSAAKMTNPSAKVRTLHLSNGRSITGTHNHPILMNGKWVPLGEIQEGQKVSTWQPMKSSDTGELSSTDIQNQKNMHTAATSPRESEISNAESTYSTAKYGNTIMESLKSQRVTTSTTRTTTRSTMTLKTLFSWMLENTSPTTCRNVLNALTSPKKHLTTLIESGPWQQRGTVPKKAESGTVSTLKTLFGQRLSNVKKFASSVATRTRRTVRIRGIGSAPISANLHGEEMQASTMFNVSAPIVGSHSPSTSIPKSGVVDVTVLRVSDGLKGQPVYNLTVEGVHQFVANGVITHNCDALRYAVFSSRWQWSRYVGRVAT